MRQLTQPIKWHGGKHYLAQRIIDRMPPDHTHYLEPFAGGLSVLLRKPCEGVAEYANDANELLTNFWQVLADPWKFEQFRRIVEATPLSEVEFANAKEYPGNEYAPVETAAAFFVQMRQSRQGLGKSYCTPTARTRRGMNENVSAWLTAVDGLADVHARLRLVEVWNRPAVDAIHTLNRPGLLVYADPPYMHETRSARKAYGPYEMSDRAHAILLQSLMGPKVLWPWLTVEEFDALPGPERFVEMLAGGSRYAFAGRFLLSGYRCPLYDLAAERGGWTCEEFDLPNNASADVFKERKTECLWRNYV